MEIITMANEPNEELVLIDDVFNEVNETKKKVIEQSEVHGSQLQISPVYVSDAERQLISAALIDPDETMAAAEEIGITHQDFYVTNLAFIWGAISKLNASKQDITILTVADHLNKSNLLEEVGGTSFIAKLHAYGIGSVHLAKAHARMILEKSTLRQIMHQTGSALERARRGDSPAAIAETLLQSLSGLHTGRSASSFADMSTTARSFVDSLPAFGGKPRGVTTGFPDVDYFYKACPGDLIIIAARPSMGKTAFVLDIARNFAVKRSEPILFFSLEMTAEQLTGRMISAHAGVESAKLRMTSDEKMRITQACGDIGSAPIFIDETPAISIAELKSRARNIGRRQNISMIAVDYIQLVTPTRQSDNRASDVGEISAGLKAIARELKCPVFALSQLNRAVEQRTDRRPLMSDLRESGSIEQDADVVSFLYREEYYAKDRTPPEKQGVAEYIVGKNRNGPTGSVNLFFNSRLPRFDSLTRN